MVSTPQTVTSLGVDMSAMRSSIPHSLEEHHMQFAPYSQYTGQYTHGLQYPVTHPAFQHLPDSFQLTKQFQSHGLSYQGYPHAKMERVESSTIPACISESSYAHIQHNVSRPEFASHSSGMLGSALGSENHRLGAGFSTQSTRDAEKSLMGTSTSSSYLETATSGSRQYMSSPMLQQKGNLDLLLQAGDLVENAESQETSWKGLKLLQLGASFPLSFTHRMWFVSIKATLQTATAIGYKLSIALNTESRKATFLGLWYSDVQLVHGKPTNVDLYFSVPNLFVTADLARQITSSLKAIKGPANVPSMKDVHTVPDRFTLASMCSPHPLSSNARDEILKGSEYIIVVHCTNRTNKVETVSNPQSSTVFSALKVALQYDPVLRNSYFLCRSLEDRTFKLICEDTSSNLPWEHVPNSRSNVLNVFLQPRIFAEYSSQGPYRSVILYCDNIPRSDVLLSYLSERSLWLKAFLVTAHALQLEGCETAVTNALKHFRSNLQSFKDLFGKTATLCT